jgi:hypothetical protein
LQITYCVSGTVANTKPEESSPCDVWLAPYIRKC